MTSAPASMSSCGDVGHLAVHGAHQGRRAVGLGLVRVDAERQEVFDRPCCYGGARLPRAWRAGTAPSATAGGGGSLLHAASAPHATKAQPGDMDDRRNRIRSPTGLPRRSP